MSELAIFGGPKSVTVDPGDMFTWPIVTEEDEQAVLEVLRNRSMSGTDVTKQFEKEFAEWNGNKYALAYNNGTASLRGAMWAVGLAAGDEMICPGMTFWASAAQALTLGVAVNFADILPDTLCIDPDDIEHRIGPRTKAIMAVHYTGYPCEMDEITAIARKHGLKVIEDNSHAQGGLYKGRRTGTLGDVAGMSMMTGKSFAIGEAGMLVTDDRMIYERAIAYGHYERTGVASNFNPADKQVYDEELSQYAGVPIGGFKHRLVQTCSAMGRVQLRHYGERIAEIDRAMTRFWDLLEGTPGIHAQRPPKGSGSTMGGWYACRGLYRAEELGGLSCARYCEAVTAEGVQWCGPGANFPLHLHPVFHTADVFRMGKPTMISFGQRDVRQGPGSLPVTESIAEICFSIPWFKYDRPEMIEEYASAFRKVAEHADELLEAGSPSK